MINNHKILEEIVIDLLRFSRAYILVSLHSSSKYLLKLVGLPARRLWQQSHGLVKGE